MTKKGTVAFKGTTVLFYSYFRNAVPANYLNCLNKSQITIPAVTDTFSECLVPY